jgi:hypothetical protein
MKRNVLLVLVVIIVSFLGGCASTSKSKTPTSPRRVFESVEIKDNISNTPFVVHDFIKDSNSFRKESIYFLTALFFSDLGILDKITKEQFLNYVSVIFSEFPQEGQVKEIIIPNLSQSSKDDAEKNAYLFITKQKDDKGRYYYLLESNIPIASIYNRPYYDGYVVQLDGSFYKNKIPASWTSIMYLYLVDNNLFYRGIAYPSKSALLINTEKGIGSDARMDAIISGQSTVAEIKNKLKETVETAVKNTEPENQSHIDSIKFLEKSSNLSLSAYSYIDGNFNDAKNYCVLSERIKVDLPDNVMGRRYNELKNIMDYLLNL